MPRVVCRYVDCIYLENGTCGSDSILVDPDEGCLSYTSVNDPEIDEVWDDDMDGLSEEDETNEGLLYDEEEDDEWMDV